MHERYYDELMRFLMRAVKDRHEAQDLAQESYERVLRRIDAGTTIDDPRALLFEVARNLLIDRYRQSLVRAHDGDEALRDLPAPPAGEPEAVYAAMQRVRLLIDTIERLPPRCRMAFVRHKIDGLSHAEVAAEMGVGLNAVERHVMLAVAACRKALGDAPRARPRAPLAPAAPQPDSTACRGG